MQRFGAVFALLYLTGCGLSAKALDPFQKNAPPHPDNCRLELSLMEGGRAPEIPGRPLENVGMVSVTHSGGRLPTDPEVLRTIKPLACHLGGDVLLVVGYDDSSITYDVQRWKPGSAK